MGTPTVRVDPMSAVGTHPVRQQWEYRTITVTGGQDASGPLTKAPR